MAANTNPTEDAAETDESLGPSLSFLFLTGAILGLRALGDLEGFQRFLREEEGATAPLLTPELLHGYKLAIGVELFNVLQEVVDEPHIMGIEPLDGLDMMFHWRHGPFPIPRGNTGHEVAIRNVWWVRQKILSSTDWPRLARAVAEARILLDPMEAIVTTCYRAKRRGTRDVPVVEMSRMILRSHIVVFLQDFANVEYAVSEIYRSGSGSRGQSLVSRDETVARPMDKVLIKGFGAAVRYLWWVALGSEAYRENPELPQRIAQAASWRDFDSLFRMADDLDTRIGGFAFERALADGLQFVSVAPISPAIRAPLVSPLGDLKLPAETFEEMFELRPVRVVGRGNPYLANSYFTALFRGLVNLAEGSPGAVKVIRVRHPVGPGNYFSYALFMPAFGTFATNASEYILILMTATDFSGGGGQAHAHIEGLIRDAGPVVTVTDKVIGDVDAFQRFLEPHQFRRFRGQFTKLSDVLSGFRGAISELLLSELFRKEGYEILGLRRSLRALGGKEVDVLAYRTRPSPELVLAESKANLKALPVVPFDGHGPTSWDTNRDMDDVLVFLDAADKACRDPRELLTELGLSVLPSITLIVASFGELVGQVEALVGGRCKLLSWDELRRRLRAGKVPESLWRPLERLSDAELPILDRGRFERDYLDFIDVDSNRRY